MPTIDELRFLQNLPLDLKVEKTKQRIYDAVQHYGVDGLYISFSGGKDSTVLLHIVRSIFPTIKAVFCDTGLEYPEIKQFVKTVDNVEIIRPAMRFDQVIEKYGFPVISKEVSRTVHYAKKALKNGKSNTHYAIRMMNGTLTDKNGRKSQYNKEKYKYLLNAPFSVSDQCCDIMKKKPFYEYIKKHNQVPITGQTTAESRLRLQTWLKYGCNAFENNKPKCNPLSFWTEQDILQYILLNDLKIAACYGDIVADEHGALYTTGVSRTGCMFCMFGVHLEESPNRFEQMKETHPKQYDYCINKLGCGNVLDYIGVKY